MVDKKIVEDRMEGLKVLCSCGNILTSLSTLYLNALDIGRWECPDCGGSYLIQSKIEKMDGISSNIPPVSDSPKKCVRMMCECGEIMYFRKTNYVNRMPPRSQWRCSSCGRVYLYLIELKTNVPKEIQI